MGRLLWDIRFKSLSFVVVLLILRCWWLSPSVAYDALYPVQRISSNCMFDYLLRWQVVRCPTARTQLARYRFLPQLIGAIERELLLLKYR